MANEEVDSQRVDEAIVAYVDWREEAAHVWEAVHAVGIRRGRRCIVCVHGLPRRARPVRSTVRASTPL